MMRPTKTDLRDLFEMAFHAAERAEQQGRDYIAVQNNSRHPLGLRIIATDRQTVCSACLMDYATDTAHNLLFALAHSWGVDFTPDDVDEWLDEIAEGEAVLF